MSQPPQMPPYGYSPQGYAPPGYAPPGYAPQYAAMPYYDAAPDALLAPARRAGWALIAMGVVALLAGTCVGALFAALAPPQLSQMLAEVQKQQPAGTPQASAAMSVTPQQLRYTMIGIGVALGGVGLVGITLGALVRTGRRGWIACGIVGCVLLSLYFAFVLLSSLLAGLASLLASAVVLALPIAATGLALHFLVQAFRNAPRIDAARQQAAYFAHYGPPPV